MKKKVTTENTVSWNSFSFLHLDYSHLSESAKRQLELQSRKDKIIAILNDWYDKKEPEAESEEPQEIEESPRTKLRRKLGASENINFYPEKEDKHNKEDEFLDERDSMNEDIQERKEKRKKNHNGSYEPIYT